ncbi:MAG: pantoate--beta-alanine ligase [Gammaproteobacteria bacterium]|nr:pantoate--beta-alanine ligase [Gammaproteobacteria bacterium]
MQIIHTITEIRQVVAELKQQEKQIGLVPTMGNLHHGHLQLVKMALAESDIVICSIFVNPLQFGEGEDFEQYPRTLGDDTQKLEEAGCHFVFAPSVDEIYPNSSCGRDQSQVTVPDISNILEGAARPGHFTGVATVVAKLFNMVQPDKAVFGAKDYQQLQVIKRFVTELCFPVKILSHPIVREENGLAMSSRNGYLSDEQKEQASALYETLQRLKRQIKEHGSYDPKFYAQIEQEAISQLNSQGFVTDYLAIRSTDLSSLTENVQNMVILLTAYLGNTRLLDNMEISLSS